MSRVSLSYHLDQPGSFGGLVLREGVVPDPGPGEVLVRVKASSINFHDLNVIEDAYAKAGGDGPVVLHTRPGLIPLSDGAGEVVAIGAGVTRFAVGDNVIPTIVQDWLSGELLPELVNSDLGGSRDGMLRQLTVLPESGLVHMPAHLDHTEGAALICAGITAWNAVSSAGLLPGQTVVVQGTGGVSLFALQFARIFGAQVIATTSSDAKADRLRQLGAEHVIDYVRNPAWGEEAMALTGGRGVDLIVETGGPTTIPQSFEALRMGGSISLVGFTGGVGAGVSPLPMLGKKLTMRAMRVGSRHDLELMCAAIATHGLRPVVDRVFPFDQAVEALEYVKGRHHLGKVVIAHD